MVTPAVQGTSITLSAKRQMSSFTFWMQWWCDGTYSRLPEKRKTAMICSSQSPHNKRANRLIAHIWRTSEFWPEESDFDVFWHAWDKVSSMEVGNVSFAALLLFSQVLGGSSKLWKTLEGAHCAIWCVRPPLNAIWACDLFKRWHSDVVRFISL